MNIYVVYDSEASIRKSWLKPLQKAQGNMKLQTC